MEVNRSLEKFGERIGALEIETAVQDNRIERTEKTMDKVEKTVSKLDKKMAVMVAIASIIIMIVQKLF